MSTIEHQEQEDKITVWTYPANGSRYSYTFAKPELELTDKFHITNPGTTDERKRRVAPTVTPAVRDYLKGLGYDSI